MSESKVFMFPDGGNNTNNGIDPNLWLALNQNGGFGNGNCWWVLFLFLLWGRNGYGFNDLNGSGTGYLSNQITNGAGRDLLMQAINGNGAAINNLSSTLNCDVNSIKTAINALQSSVCQVGNQVGMSAADVKNAITTGNMSITQQLAQCCCDIRDSITRGNYENQLQTVNQTNQLQQAINSVGVGQERGFSSVAYETQRQTCDIQRSIKDLGTQITAQFGDLATRALQDKLDAEREKNSSLMNQLSNEHQTALIGQQIAAATTPLATAIAGVTRDVDSIKCKLPDTATVPNPPGVLMPNCVAWNTFGMNPFMFNQNGSIWS